MRCFIALVGLLGVASAARFGPIADDAGEVDKAHPFVMDELFDKWATKHQKSYVEVNGLGATEEYTKRLSIFTRNWHYVARMA
eukprot:2315141-Pyramimonas_sp.AAC.1